MVHIWKECFVILLLFFLVPISTVLSEETVISCNVVEHPDTNATDAWWVIRREQSGSSLKIHIVQNPGGNPWDVDFLKRTDSKIGAMRFLALDATLQEIRAMTKAECKEELSKSTKSEPPVVSSDAVTSCEVREFPNPENSTGHWNYYPVVKDGSLLQLFVEDPGENPTFNPSEYGINAIALVGEELIEENGNFRSLTKEEYRQRMREDCENAIAKSGQTTPVEEAFSEADFEGDDFRGDDCIETFGIGNFKYPLYPEYLDNEQLRTFKDNFARCCWESGGLYDVQGVYCVYCEGREVYTRGQCKDPDDRSIEEIYNLPAIGEWGGEGSIVPVGYLNKAKGAIFLYRRGVGWRVARRGVSIFSGDVIITKSDSMGEIVFGGSSRMYITERTSLLLPGRREEEMGWLEWGAINTWENIKRIARNEPYDPTKEIGAGHSISSRKGTDYIIEVDKETQIAIYTVNKGSVEVWLKDDPSTKRELGAGESAQVTENLIQDHAYEWESLLENYDWTDRNLSEPPEVRIFAPIDSDTELPPETSNTGEIVGGLEERAISQEDEVLESRKLPLNQIIIAIFGMIVLTLFYIKMRKK